MAGRDDNTAVFIRTNTHTHTLSLCLLLYSHLPLSGLREPALSTCWYQRLLLSAVHEQNVWTPGGEYGEVQEHWCSLQVIGVTFLMWPEYRSISGTVDSCSAVQYVPCFHQI